MVNELNRLDASNELGQVKQVGRDMVLDGLNRLIELDELNGLFSLVGFGPVNFFRWVSTYLPTYLDRLNNLEKANLFG